MLSLLRSIPAVSGLGASFGAGLRVCASINGVRHYADVKQAKTGQKKTAKRDEDAGDALAPFEPKPADGPLHIFNRATHPSAADMPADPRASMYGHRLLRSIDADLRKRHDTDNRTALFTKGSPEAIEPGSIILVEQISSRSSPRKLAFAGVLLNVKRRGVLSSITVRNYVLGTGVEVVYPIYSPMVTRIKVLKRVKPGFSKGGDQVNFLREKPGAAPLSFNAIEEMVIRNNETERKRSQIRLQK
ncbi:hypothetical protein HDU81_006789 [Chytriomyces hyalinus]|nr:hypothetical protein HDU81_006789 [Chytriomyces hyalinus]